MADLSPKHFPSLTVVMRAVVKNVPHSLCAEYIAKSVGKECPTLLSELRNYSGHKLGADLLLPLMDACESDAPVKFLANQRGGTFVKMPEVQSAGCE